MKKTTPVQKRLDATYFNPSSCWANRVQAWLNDRDDVILEGNAEAIRNLLDLKHPQAGLRMVVNISAEALRSFLREKRYKNAYDRPVVAGQRRGPSPTREKVDDLLDFTDKEKMYFGAVALGGSGIRFYGEYCMVLRLSRVRDDTRIFDRNSYDLERSPLADIPDKTDTVRALKGTWTADLVEMIRLKVIARLAGMQSLITAGTVSDLILHDEEYVEVHLEGTFSPADVEEVREFGEDHIVAGEIAERYRQGTVPTAEEILWCSRRYAVVADLRQHRVSSRAVVTSGRGGRWR